jgi:hypothetical protein
VKLKLIFVGLTIALMQITPSDAQSISPAGHYTKKRYGPGDLWVQKVGAEWRIFVWAGGVPRGPGGSATTQDCALIAVGAIEGKTFQGEVKYDFDASEFKAQREAGLDYLKGGSSKPSSANSDDVEAGLKMTITFAPQSATVNDVDWEAPCPPHAGIFGRYTKRRK